MNNINLGHLNSIQTDLELYSRLHQQIANQIAVIDLKGALRFTKTAIEHVDTKLIRDKGLEKECRRVLQSYIGIERFLQRYQAFPGSPVIVELPQHIPVRLRAGQNIGSSKNVFLVFPFALGVDDDIFENIFGFELIDYSVLIFEKVITPSIRELFTNSNDIINFLINPLSPALWNFIYGLSHEIGHYSGHWRLSHPNRERSFYFDTNSELAADLITFSVLPELPSLILGVFLMRLFWYMHEDPRKDADAAVATFLLSQALQAEAISAAGNQYHLNIHKLVKCLSSISNLEDLVSPFFEITYGQNPLQGIRAEIIKRTAPIVQEARIKC